MSKKEKKKKSTNILNSIHNPKPFSIHSLPDVFSATLAGWVTLNILDCFADKTWNILSQGIKIISGVHFDFYSHLNSEQVDSDPLFVLNTIKSS